MLLPLCDVVRGSIEGEGRQSGKKRMVKYRRIVIYDQRVTSAKKSGFAGVLRGIGGSTITRK